MQQFYNKINLNYRIDKYSNECSICHFNYFAKTCKIVAEKAVSFSPQMY